MRNIYFYIFVFFTILLASSCSVQPAKTSPANAEILINRDLHFLLLPAFAVDRPLSLTQSVKIQYEDKQYDFIARMEIADQSFKMVGITSVGIKLFSIDSADNYYEFETTSLIGKELNLTYLLADLQLAYWPVNMLNLQLQKDNAFIEINPKQRLISKNNKVIIDIQYSNSNHWNKNITFKHLQRNYSVIINTLEMEYL